MVKKVTNNVPIQPNNSHLPLIEAGNAGENREESPRKRLQDRYDSKWRGLNLARQSANDLIGERANEHKIWKSFMKIGITDTGLK